MSKFQPIKFKVASDFRNNCITIDRCEGSRLPKQPYMWAVRNSFEDVLDKEGEWCHEPLPSHRDEQFYAACRFDTYEDAEKAAVAKAVASGMKLEFARRKPTVISDLDKEIKMVIVAAHGVHRKIGSTPMDKGLESSMAALGYALEKYDEKYADQRAINLIEALFGEDEDDEPEI